MRASWAQGLALCLAALAAALPARANRLTFEVWPDASPDHTVACSVGLSDGWISLVQVTGVGLPRPDPMRWRATHDEVEAVADGLQALVGGELRSVDPYLSPPPSPSLQRLPTLEGISHRRRSDPAVARRWPGRPAPSSRSHADFDCLPACAAGLRARRLALGPGRPEDRPCARGAPEKWHALHPADPGS